MTTPQPVPKPEGMDPETSPPRELSPARRAEVFRALFWSEFSYVCHSLRRLGVRRHELEDVAHDVFVAVVRHMDVYDPGRPLRPWLFGFAFRVALDHRRLARHRHEVVGVEAEAIDDAPGADAQIEAQQARRLVAEALGAIELDRRAVFVMHDLDGHPMREIANALAIPINTAFSRLRLARGEFRDAVARIRLRRGER